MIFAIKKFPPVTCKSHKQTVQYQNKFHWWQCQSKINHSILYCSKIFPRSAQTFQQSSCHNLLSWVILD